MKITRYPEEFGIYRYKLRVDEIDLVGGDTRGELVFVMLNPATTKEEEDLLAGSHTRRRCIKFAKDRRYGALIEVNLFAYRSCNKSALSKVLRDSKVDPIGPENDQIIRETVKEADMVIVAWGNVGDNPVFRRRADEVTNLLLSMNIRLYCLAKNEDGSPKHPARGSHNNLERWV